MTIYVGNLSYDADQDSVTELFCKFGSIKRVTLPIDKMTNRKKGFCFVEMENESDEDSAISAINDAEFLGRQLRVNKAMSNGTGGGSGGRPSGGFGGSGERRNSFRGGDRGERSSSSYGSRSGGSREGSRHGSSRSNNSFGYGGGKKSSNYDN